MPGPASNAPRPLGRRRLDHLERSDLNRSIASSHMLVSDSASHGWFGALVFGGLGSFSRGKVLSWVLGQVGSDARPNLVDPASSHMLVSDSA